MHVIGVAHDQVFATASPSVVSLSVTRTVSGTTVTEPLGTGVVWDGLGHGQSNRKGVQGIYACRGGCSMYGCGETAMRRAGPDESRASRGCRLLLGC